MSRLARVTVAVLVGASVVQAALALGVTRSSRAIRLHDSPDLVHLVRTEQRSLRFEYELYLLLEPIVDGATIVAAEPLLLPDLVDGLADAVFRVDPTLPPADPDTARALSSGARLATEFRPPGAEEPRTVLVVPPDRPPRLLRVVEVGDRLLIAAAEALRSPDG